MGQILEPTSETAFGPCLRLTSFVSATLTEASRSLLRGQSPQIYFLLPIDSSRDPKRDEQRESRFDMPRNRERRSPPPGRAAKLESKKINKNNKQAARLRTPSGAVPGIASVVRPGKLNRGQKREIQKMLDTEL